MSLETEAGGLALGLVGGLIQLIAEAIQRGDPDAVQELSKHLDGPDVIVARAAAMRAAQRRAAELLLAPSKPSAEPQPSAKPLFADGTGPPPRPSFAVALSAFRPGERVRLVSLDGGPSEDLVINEVHPTKGIRLLRDANEPQPSAKPNLTELPCGDPACNACGSLPPCPDCNGTGAGPVCPHCGGTGYDPKPSTARGAP